MGFKEAFKTNLHNPMLKWVELVVRYFGIVLGVWAVATIVLGVGMIYLASDNEIEAAIDTYEKSAFNAKEDLFDEFPDYGKYQILYLMARDDNILTLDHYKEIKEFDTRFRTEVEYDGLYYTDLCKKYPTIYCLELAHPLGYWIQSPTVYDISSVETDEQLLAQINSGRNTNGGLVNARFMFGDPEPLHFVDEVDGTNNLTRSSGVFFYLPLESSDDFEDDVNDFEIEMEDFFDDFNDDAKFIKARGITYSGVSRGAVKMIALNTGIILVVGLPLMLGIYFLVFIRLGCRLLMFEQAVGTFITIVAAFFQGVGLSAWARVPDSLSGAGVAPFLLFVVSLSHSFFILAVFNRTVGDPIVRVKDTYRVVGGPLLGLSVMHVLTFAFLSIWNIVRLGHVCAILAIVYTFLIFNWFSLTPVLLWFSAWRQSRNLGDFGCCPLSNERTVAESERELESETQEQTQPQVSELKEPTRYTKALSMGFKFPVQITVGALLLVFLAINIAYSSMYFYEIKPAWLTIKYSSINHGLKTRLKGFRQNGFGCPFSCHNTELSKTSQQVKLIELAEAIDTCKDCDEDWVVDHSLVSWYNNFRGWVSAGACTISGDTVALNSEGVVDSEYFAPCLKQYFASSGAFFKQNAKWNDDETEVISTFFTVNIHFLADEDVRTGINDIRDVADFGPGDCSPYNPMFIFYDHYDSYAERMPLHYMLVFIAIALCTLGGTLSFVEGLLATLLTCSAGLSMLAVTVYSSNIQCNAITETLTVIAFGTSADFYVYYLAFLEATPVSKDRAFIAYKQFIWPASSKLLVILGALLALAAAPNFRGYAVIALLYGFVNFLQSVFVLPLVMRLTCSKKKNVHEAEMQGTEITERSQKKDLEVSMRLKDDQTVIGGDVAS